MLAPIIYLQSIIKLFAAAIECPEELFLNTRVCNGRHRLT